MLSGMRKGLGRFGATLILAPLIGAFAIWGIGDVFKGAVKDSVATVNGEGISERDFLSTFDRGMRRVQQQAQQQGKTITADEARAKGFDKSLLDDMIVSKALAQAAQKLGFTISDAALASQIKEIPGFQNELKKFDKLTYERQLGQAGYTSDSFEKELRADLVRSQLGAAAASGAYLPASFIVQELKLRSEARSLKYVKVPPSAIPLPAAPTDAEIKAFYDTQGGQLYAVPEFRAATIVLLRPKDFAAKAVIPDADINAQLAQRADSLRSPEKRSFHQIPAANPAIAAQIAARAKKGESLTAIAKSLKLDAPIVGVDQAQTEIPDALIGSAIFAAKKGDIIGPVTGSLGAASVIIVDSITPAGKMDEAKARAQIREELAEDRAKDALYQTLEIVDDAISGGATLEQAAQKAGLPVTSFEPVDRQGFTIRREPIEALVPEKIRANLFNLAAGQQSDADTLDDGTYYIIRADKVKPADKMPLEAVKKDAAQRVFIQKRIEAIKAKSEAFVALAQAKGGLANAAVAQGLKVQERPKPLHRGEPDPIFDERASATIFAAGLNETVVMPTADGGFLAAEVTSITREDPRSKPDLLAKFQASTVGKYGTEIAGVYQQAVMARSKIQTDQKRFDKANGRDPESAE